MSEWLQKAQRPNGQTRHLKTTFQCNIEDEKLVNGRFLDKTLFKDVEFGFSDNVQNAQKPITARRLSWYNPPLLVAISSMSRMRFQMELNLLMSSAASPSLRLDLLMSSLSAFWLTLSIASRITAASFAFALT
jgi:hypothetical protein